MRAKHDRVLGVNKPKLFATMSGGAPEGRMTIETDGLVARPKLSGNKERPARTRRLASCEVRFRHVTLPATVKRADPISLRGVHIVETAPPWGEKPVRWFLLTGLDVRTARDTTDIVGFYLQRWGIEDFFLVRKSGRPDIGRQSRNSCSPIQQGK